MVGVFIDLVNICTFLSRIVKYLYSPLWNNLLSSLGEIWCFGNMENHFHFDSTWVFPAVALAFGNVVLLLMMVINGLFLHELGWRWLGALRCVFLFFVYGYWVACIRCFKLSPESVAIYSFWGLSRQYVRWENVDRVYGCWVEDGLVPAVYVCCRNGQVIRLNKGRRKLCNQLILEIQNRLAAGVITPTFSLKALPEVQDGVQVLLTEWIWDYINGLFVLFIHGFLLYMFLQK